jgi:ADP-dependent NAD(P)H-hydrate dehydratase / NAD(P)H-hydrate epimerase
MAFPILHASTLRVIEAQNAQAEPSLMERAGAAAVRVAHEMLPDAPSSHTPLVLAGPGNNGGDALVVARRLKEAGFAPQVLFSGDPAHLPDDARRAHSAWLAAGGTCRDDYPPGSVPLIIDGLFGIGLTRPIEGIHAEWIRRANFANVPILALDIPSGLNAATGKATGPVITAHRTVSFIALKPGLLTGDGPDHCGHITLCDLGLDIPHADGEKITPALFHHCLRPRPRNSHKGSFGSVTLIGGAQGMAGAVLLAGRAALKLGAGRVYLGMLEQLALDPGQPELMLRDSTTAMHLATVLAIGPGLGQSAQAGELLEQAIATIHPLILDADALNLLAQNPLLQHTLTVRPAPTFITPHPAEAARLLGCTTAEVEADRLAAACRLARNLRAHVALKGGGTIVATPDERWFINATGNPGLATAGSGDVLTGILAALLAQSWPPLEALLAAVHLHGTAADACVADGQGPIGLTAGELIPPARTLLNEWIGPRPSPAAPENSRC